MSTACWAFCVRLVFNPLLKTLLMKLMAAVNLCDQCLLPYQFKAKTTMITLCIWKRWLIFHVFEYSMLLHSFKFCFERKPSQRIRRLNSLLYNTIINQKIDNHRFKCDEKYKTQEKKRQYYHNKKENSRCHLYLLSLYIFDIDIW